MFDESLLEFEESLSLISSSHELMLNNLDLKVEINRFSDGNSRPLTYSRESIKAIFDEYSYYEDELTCCDQCGHPLSEMHSGCCAQFIRTHREGFGSSTESSYWMSFLNNPYKTMVALPNYTKMVFLQKGMPFQLRPLIWQKLVLVNHHNLTHLPESCSMIYKNFQHSYNRSIAKQIDKDLSRTFPNVSFFEQQETISSLQTILNVYANYDLELGYCQGLLFLVGTLYAQFKNNELTFHALCKVTESEPELRKIFMPGTMSATLDKWYEEFFSVLFQIDEELAYHLHSLCDCKVFLFQWWLSFSLIHAPDMTINNKVIDFCLMEGWKVGSFKISMGLLLKNKPILMSFSEQDEEVVYQHLLNGSKWGNAINSLPEFFGDLLLSWDEKLFRDLNVAAAQPVFKPLKTPKKTHLRSRSVIDKFKMLTINTSDNYTQNMLTSLAESLTRARSNTNDSYEKQPSLTHSTTTVFSAVSGRADAESIYSDLSSCSSEANRSLGDFLKLPAQKKSASDSASVNSRDAAFDELVLENQMLRFLLKKASENITDESVRREINEAMDWE